MLYGRSLADPGHHESTLTALVRRKDIETFDCCLPEDPVRQDRLAQAIRASGKERIVFAIHMFPFSRLSLATTQPDEQAEVRSIIDRMVAQAAAIGATGFIFASGGPPFAQGTVREHQAFRDFCRWLCGRLAPHGMVALLEPFDFDFDKKFLYGPLDRNLELVAAVAAEFPNIGIELDMAHLPLMREGFASAIRRAAPWLKRVHLGNCVTRNAADPFFGDKHPPMGYPGGEIDVPQLVEILSTLQEVGYLSRANRGDLVLELNPFPGRSEDDSVADNLRRLDEAWALATTPSPAQAAARAAAGG